MTTGKLFNTGSVLSAVITGLLAFTETLDSATALISAIIAILTMFGIKERVEKNKAIDEALVLENEVRDTHTYYRAKMDAAANPDLERVIDNLRKDNKRYLNEIRHYEILVQENHSAEELKRKNLTVVEKAPRKNAKTLISASIEAIDAPALELVKVKEPRKTKTVK